MHQSLSLLAVAAFVVALAVVPPSLVSVLLVVGGIVVWSQLPRMVARLAVGGADGMGIIGAMIFGVGGVLLFPVWGAAPSVAALGYYFRRRAACSVCGRGTSTEVGEVVEQSQNTAAA